MDTCLDNGKKFSLPMLQKRKSNKKVNVYVFLKFLSRGIFNIFVLIFLLKVSDSCYMFTLEIVFLVC